MSNIGVNVLVEAKNQYTNRLINTLLNHIYDGIQSIYDDSKNLDQENVFSKFQEMLKQVPKWNQEMIDQETQRIVNTSDCEWLSDLITAVFLSNTRILTAVRLNSSKDSINLKIPKLSHFVHKCYIECAREFYKNPFIFDDTISNGLQQKNMRDSLRLISDSIQAAIDRMLPYEQILMQYIGESFESDEEDAGDSRIKRLKRRIFGDDFDSEYESDYESDDSDEETNIGLADEKDQVGGDQKEENVEENLEDNVENNVEETSNDNKNDLLENNEDENNNESDENNDEIEIMGYDSDDFNNEDSLYNVSDNKELNEDLIEALNNDESNEERKLNETEREVSETKRKMSGKERKMSGKERDTSETERDTNETKRQTSETERDTSETNRETSETERDTNETERDKNETERDRSANERDIEENDQNSIPKNINISISKKEKIIETNDNEDKNIKKIEFFSNDSSDDENIVKKEIKPKKIRKKGIFVKAVKKKKKPKFFS